VNVKVRHLWIFLLLGATFVVVGGTASSFGAPPCGSDVDHFDVSINKTAVQVGEAITVTVIAKSAAPCNDTVKSYKGPATLTANGTSAAGSATTAGIGPTTLTFTNGTGTATADVTPTSDALGVTLTATDSSVSPSITGTTAPVSFVVFDSKFTCTATGCVGSDDDSEPTAQATTRVSVNIPEAGLNGQFLGLSTSPHTATDCSTTGAAPMGSLYTIAPPLGLQKNYSATVRYPKEVAPGTGVSNFVHCMRDLDSLTFTQVKACKRSSPTPCISDQRRDGVGDLVVTFLLSPGDPVGGGFS
jgi:hypothetical protein